MRKLLTILAVVAAVVTTWVSNGLAFEYGDAAPGFALADFSGKQVQLSDFKGKVVVLKLATTWCPTCKQQSAEIESLIPYLDEHDITVIDVFLQDTREMVDEYLEGKTHPKNYLPLVDDGQARTAYNVYLIPRLLIIDREQKVRRDGSLLDAGSLKALLEGALKS